MTVEDARRWDLIVIGGGFYGCSIALHAARRWGLQRVLLAEREGALLQRASWRNQARVHGGYHYPRSYTTAYRSRANYPRFLADWPEATRRDITALYAIARRQSKLTARQFERFAADIGAPLARATSEHAGWFDDRRIEALYRVDEAVFDASILATRATEDIASAGIALALGTQVTGIETDPAGGLAVAWTASTANGCWSADRVLNCSYAGLAAVCGDAGATGTPLKHEITEMALVRVPPALDDVAITVMDGPFFSLVPFPPRRLHTLSHVRYTPHASWVDDGRRDPYAVLAAHAEPSRFGRMRRDAALYAPILGEVAHVESMTEIKTVPLCNETDDGRPIVFAPHPRLAGVHSILGGKIDNIEDVLARLGEQPPPADAPWTP